MHEEMTVGSTRAEALGRAQEWASERYGLELTERTPFGSYGDPTFVRARLKALKQQIRERGIEVPALKVFSWTDWRNGVHQGEVHRGQTREMIAAKSKAAAMREAGITASTFAHSGGEVGNDQDREIALQHPGVVFWRPLDTRPRGTWTRAT